MDFETKLKQMSDQIEKARGDLVVLTRQHRDAKEFTSVFLAVCEKYKISKVAIGVMTDKLDVCKTWPKGWGGRGNVFSNSVRHGGDNADDGWPAIWKVAEELGISGGCGNGMQHAISHDAESQLVDGYYELRNGKWRRTTP